MISFINILSLQALHSFVCRREFIFLNGEICSLSAKLFLIDFFSFSYEKGISIMTAEYMLNTALIAFRERQHLPLYFRQLLMKNVTEISSNFISSDGR